MRGLGTSYNSEYYGLENEAEWIAYLQHPILGPRYFETVDVIHYWIVVRGKSPIELMGSDVDVMKLESSLGLLAGRQKPGGEGR